MKINLISEVLDFIDLRLKFLGSLLVNLRKLNLHQVLLDSFKVAHHALDHLFLVADFVPDRLKLLVQSVCLSQVDEAGELELVLLAWSGFGVVAGVFSIVSC